MEVSPAGPKPFNREAEVAALGRAIAVERRARYVDCKGKRTTFSQFMRQTADKLCKRYPLESRWSTIRGLYQHYANMDLASRMKALSRTEELLLMQEDAPPARTIGGAEPAGTKANTQLTSQSRIKSPSRGRPRSQSKSPGERVRATSKNGGTSQQDRDPSSVEVKFVKGVGPKMSELLEKLGIYTAWDLIRHYPREHVDFQDKVPIKQLEPGQRATVFGIIRNVGAFQSKNKNVSIVSITISDGTGSILISRFIGGKSNHYLLERYKSQYPKGAQVLASGTVELDGYSGRKQLRNAEVEVLAAGGGLDGEESLHVGRLVPIYPLTEGIGLRFLRTTIHNALEAFDRSIDDPLPAEIRTQYELLGLREAIWGIHFPDDIETKDAARRRLVFDELFGVQIQLAMRRYKMDSVDNALCLPLKDSGKVDRFVRDLPFKLTNAQERVFKQISTDLSAPKPMHRLVQGDVGSGKTVVAAMACLIAIDNGYQVAVMAPTEILAEQHFRHFEGWLTGLGLRCGLFLGKQGVKERRAMQQDLRSGQIHVAIGTHALLEDDVEFQQLGLIIIDEQHRFGVKQRAKLKAKGANPELLTMTATPIPRTLALTLHGDLDVSEIDELPPGRKPVKTELKSSGQKKEVFAFVKSEVMQGRQAYIVFPLIDESETLSAKAATAEFERLQREDLATCRLGLMHGKLKPAEKEEVMDKFRKREFDALVCTTVIEVGVDVPNASVMVIENADRFGLAQLHQLRGRVGRGAEQSYCFLISNSTSEPTRQRLEVMTQTNDGFVIAERDLQIRGPGEFMGVRQSGLPDLLLADIVNDAKILEEARRAAIELIKSDPELKKFPKLRNQVRLAMSKDKMDLVASG